MKQLWLLLPYQPFESVSAAFLAAAGMVSILLAIQFVPHERGLCNWHAIVKL